jgi:hypothetical protein
VFLSNVAARYQGRSLASFIENALTDALSPARVLKDEPSVSEPTTPVEPILWSEGLWDENEATRIFRVAIKGTDLLSPSQEELYIKAMANLAQRQERVTERSFSEAFNALEQAL